MTASYQPIAKVSEIRPGDRKIVTVKGKEIGIFNIKGTFHAFLNRCPHMGAPLCKGLIIEKIESDAPGSFRFKSEMVLRCPWHRWEFDIASGEPVFDPSIRAKKYEVKVKNGTLYCKV